ncbi:DUF6895 family protein [Streptomyces griseoviridis]|uniref:DUF6895 domain-containing protein n=1 Tax=Streptomyces griseoviridis TaxID=45398 RepID=A0ABT9LQL9_STRGD|nr:hypothetical protein [Streptomyces griseoviridis]GGS77490.1 hypothetical protein GCM10010240_08170 [Streptomyces griseoviridis]
MSAVTVRAAETRGVRDVAEAALGWVAAHRAEFTLGEDALAAYGQVDSTWKPLGELAQVCATVTRRTPPADPLHTRARDLLAHAWDQTERGALFLDMQRQEPFATYPLEVYAAFAAAGLRHPGYETAAATVARTRGWRLVEQGPTRRLGVLAAERYSGITRPEPAAAVRDGTWLGGLPEPWTFEAHAGYALTHVVFHLTDWGRAGPAGVPPRLAAYLTQWLAPWLDTCLEARMWDLSCELLAVAASVPGSLDPPAHQEAWSRLAAAQRPSGALPETGPAGDTDPDGTDGFGHCYHSTLLAAFAAALTDARHGQGAPG